jgi:hypothetical protein
MVQFPNITGMATLVRGSLFQHWPQKMAGEGDCGAAATVCGCVGQATLARGRDRPGAHPALALLPLPSPLLGGAGGVVGWTGA